MKADPEKRALWGIQLGQVANKRFVLVSGEWPLEKARELTARLDPKRLIVRIDSGGEAAYYLTAIDRLSGAVGPTMGDAVASAGLSVVPALEISLDAEEAPDQCIVLDDGAVVGFFDASMDPPDIQRGGSVGEPEPEAVVRLLTVEMEPRVPLGRTVSLLVWLAQPDPFAMASLPMSLPPGSEVDVYVRTAHGFEIAGPREARLLLSTGDDMLPVKFRLKAKAPGPARIEVFAFFRSSCLGRIELTPIVTAEGDEESPVPYESFLVPPPHEEEPDLTLVIFEIGQGSDLKLLVRLGAPGTRIETKTFAPISVRLEPRKYLNDFFADIEKLRADSDETSRKAVALQLAAKGVHLCEQLLPEDLRALLWGVRHQIRTLAILSDEAWIPWEICRLAGWENGRIVEGGYFCELAMARWVLRVKPRPAPILRRMGIVASVKSELPAAMEEQKKLLGLAGADLRVDSVPSRFVDLMEHLKSGKYDGLHFAGHGDFRDPNADRSRIVLDDGDELRPEHLFGESANLGAARPLVFLNACQAGRSALTLTGMGGWAPSFLRAGAAAFLGPAWSVGDKAAARFASLFYEKLLAGLPIAEAVRSTRLQVRDDFPGNPAWLAYTLFADPLARMVAGKEDG